LVPATVVNPQSPDFVEPVSATGRLSIRLRSDDLLLLRERARAREMPTSAYVSLLIRSHLRALTLLPIVELVALKRSVAEIGAIGRNLNQIARAVNQGERPNGPSKADLQAQRAGSTHLRDRQQRIIGEWSAGTLKWGDGEVKLAKTRQEVVEGWRGVSVRLKTDGDLSRPSAFRQADDPLYTRQFPSRLTSRSIE